MILYAAENLKSSAFAQTIALQRHGQSCVLLAVGAGALVVALHAADTTLLRLAHNYARLLRVETCLWTAPPCVSCTAADATAILLSCRYRQYKW